MLTIWRAVWLLMRLASLGAADTGEAAHVPRAKKSCRDAASAAGDQASPAAASGAPKTSARRRASTARTGAASSGVSGVCTVCVIGNVLVVECERRSRRLQLA